MPCQVNVASSGSRTWKLKETVPTRAIIASGMRSSGVRADVAQRGAQLAARARGRRGACAAAGVHQAQRDDHRQEGERR